MIGSAVWRLDAEEPGEGRGLTNEREDPSRRQGAASPLVSELVWPYMWKMVVAVILATVCMEAQAFPDLLLPQARHITGVVVDPEGKPVVEARIDHTNQRRQAYQTDSEGRFELETTAPILVVRKAGFRSELVRTQDTTEARVTLQELSGNRLFPTCSNTGQYDGIHGWGASFEFPTISDVKASPQGQDIDYGARSYYVETKAGPKGLGMAAGQPGASERRQIETYGGP